MRDPEDPEFLGTCGITTGKAAAITMQDGLAYVGSLQVVDVSDPSAPHVIGQESLPEIDARFGG